MMTDQEMRTLAYAKSPKTSKRTTFQDELQAAVSSRASKTKAQQHFYYDDINDEEDDFLNNLLKSRKKRIDAFKAVRSKATFNTFDLSDEEDKHSKPKKVSFLKAQRSSSMSKDTSASEPHESSNDGNVNNDGSLSSQRSTNVNDENSHINPSGEEPTNCLITKQTLSLSYQTSDDALSFPLPSDGSVVETPGPEEKTRNSVMEETSQTPPVSAPHLNNTVAADIIPEREPPRPKPRQRTLGLKSQVSQKKAEEESASQDFSRPQTSSVSIPLSTDASSNITVRTHINYFLIYVPFISSGSPLRTPSSHSKMTQRSQSACSRKVESKYLGTLKVLDRKLSLQESSPQAAESIRAAVYQVRMSLCFLFWYRRSPA
ncbi:hypothetical protein GOODEAATRI_027952 [Goodea atripinnis]|uniref:Uncharacterized protein n=1 Tax=Goodea atripinnis TaxID=208336 RepID=A0ABV0MVQ9_9TELE